MEKTEEGHSTDRVPQLFVHSRPQITKYASKHMFKNVYPVNTGVYERQASKHALMNVLETFKLPSPFVASVDGVTDMTVALDCQAHHLDNHGCPSFSVISPHSCF